MINPYPKTCNLCGGSVEYVSNAKIYGKPYGSGYCYHCRRCGATFYERQPNRICERCRIQRKKQGYRKYLHMKGGTK